MEGNTPLNFLISVFSIGLLFYIVFVAYQNYRVARFRYEVFKLRDKLFQEAAEGLIGFDHDAYKVIRILMNGHIRFAHKLSLWEPVLLYLFERFQGRVNSEHSFSSAYTRAANDLDRDTKEELDKYLSKLDHLVMRHIFFALPEFFLLTVPMFLVSFSRALYRMLPRITVVTMEGFTRNRVTDAAFAVGERAARQTSSIPTHSFVSSQ